MRLDVPAALALRGGRVVLGSHIVLAGVDFSLEEGEFVALLGPNGSGKTTLVRALLGLVPLNRGRVELFGRPPASFRSWERIGYVPQRVTATTGVPATVGEVVLSGRVARARALGGWRPVDRAAAGRALETVGLGDLERASVSSLSGGQQQRVLIARALAGEPDVLLLDEPVSGMDVESRRDFTATLESLARTGRSVLLVAHALEAMAPLVTRTVMLTGGSVVYDGAPRPGDVDLEDSHPHADAPEAAGFRRAMGRS
jgi:zinc transport system ATP-binding protein